MLHRTISPLIWTLILSYYCSQCFHLGNYKPKQLQFELQGHKNLDGHWFTNLTADFQENAVDNWNIKVKRLESHLGHLHVEVEVKG